MAKPNPNRLLVEGEVDKRVIPELMEANGILWGPRARQAPVFIAPYGGIDNLLRPGSIETELKASGLQALGIVADADDDAIAQWRRIRDQCLPHFPGLPDELPEAGLIQSHEHGVKLGIWIMPDNCLRGMLETFLAYLVPTASQSLWTYATEAVAEAKTLGAPYRGAHIDKAKIYTWLAWQAPPWPPATQRDYGTYSRSSISLCIRVRRLVSRLIRPLIDVYQRAATFRNQPPPQ